MIFNLLERYIARAILRATLLTLLALACMLVFFTFVDELDDVHQTTYRTLDAFQVALLSMPRHLFEVFPPAALLGGLLGLGGLSRHAELVAMRTAGFGVQQIAYATLKTGVLILLLMVFIGEWLAPVSAQYAQQLRLAKQQGQVASMTEHGFWAWDGNQYINIERIMSGAHLQGINRYQFNDTRELVSHSRAATADYQNGDWLLRDIQQSVIKPDGISTRRIQQARWDSILNPALLSVAAIQPDRLAMHDLYRYIRFMQANHQDAINYQVAFWGKLAMPVLAILMLLLAVPFALTRQRSDTGQRIFIGAVVGALFFLLMRAAAYTSVAYDLNPLLLMFMPALACLALVFSLLQRVR